MKSGSIPDRVEPVRTYDALEKWARDFALGKYPALLVLGNPGNGKSTAFNQALEAEGFQAGDEYGVCQKGFKPYCLVEGHSLALDCFKFGFYYRDCPMVFDDCNTLYKDQRTRPLLINLCETHKVKRLRWNTNAKLPVPKAYTTTSNVVFIANEFRVNNNNMEALVSRCDCIIHFIPTAKELHAHVGKWFPNKSKSHKEVYEFIEENLYMMNHPDQRIYEHVRRYLAADNRDWREFALRMLCPALDKKAIEVVYKILNDKTFDALKKPEDLRVKAFRAATGMSHMTYYRYKKIIEDNGGNLPSA